MHRHQLPVLDPCHEDFDAMRPDGPRRHCERCKTAVHDLSAMTRAEARLLLLRHRGQPLCVRYGTRPDGQLRFRPAPARTAGVVVTALAGLMAACTSTAQSVEVDTEDTIVWEEEAGPTIPGDRNDRVELEPGFVTQIVVPRVPPSPVRPRLGSMLMGLVRVDEQVLCEHPPPPEHLLHTRVRDEGESPTGAQGGHEGRRGRQERRADRKQRRHRRRRAQRVVRDERQEQRKSERELQRQIRTIEREVRREHRREARALRRQRRRAERKRGRQQRRERRKARREARRPR